MAAEIRDNPANRNPVPGSIWLYTPRVHRKLDAIAWAITYHLHDKRASSAPPTPRGGE
jgi:hypothetical protein